MQHLLLTLFSAVCGENPGHIWSPGGQPLPCCERCMGLYVGALAAVALHLWCRPVITKRFLQLHAVCLLQLGLFVFPWLPQSAVLRTVSGTLFGFGVVAFLWPAVSDWRLPFRTSRFGIGVYAMGLVGGLAIVLGIAEWGGRPGAFVLTGLILAGVIALAVLASVNVVRCLMTLVVQKWKYA
jgi:uncharacterized membrane protein